MMVTVASRAFAAQISFPSGEMSKPSTPLPAGTFVISQVRRVCPPGPPGPCGAGPAGGPDPADAPGGGPKPPAGEETCSMMLTVAELTLEVKILSKLLETSTM